MDAGHDAETLAAIIARQGRDMIFVQFPPLMYGKPQIDYNLIHLAHTFTILSPAYGCFGFALHGVGHRHTVQGQLAVDTIPMFYKLLHRLPLFFPCDIEKGEDTRNGASSPCMCLLQRIEWFSSSIRAGKYADEVYHSALCVEKTNKIIAHFRLVCRERS